jgi:1,4-alpha-glucan branching enzyme
MLQDPLLQQRYYQRLNELIDLAEKETQRTVRLKEFHELSLLYLQKLLAARVLYDLWKRDLVRAFRTLQERGRLEIITSAATHALLPLLAHPPSLRAQILVARDHYCDSFGCEPRGIWLPECAYSPELEGVLREAGLRWFIVETHGILHAKPQPRGAIFAPILTPNGIAVFGRDPDSAQKVWSRERGYPADARYRDFYRDIGFDLNFEYVARYALAPNHRGYTGFKYFRSTNSSTQKQPYLREAALEATAEHAGHFIQVQKEQILKLNGTLGRPPILVCPYDAELFGHWWYEGPEFLNCLVRKICLEEKWISLITPEDYLGWHPSLQISTPAASSWGEGGYYDVWINEKNEWIYSRLAHAQKSMTSLVARSSRLGKLEERALKQAGRELLLAQASDWPFMIRAGTSPDFAKERINRLLHNFSRLEHEICSQNINEEWLGEIEAQDNLFPNLDYRYWA